jgi:hypothetical protein
MRHLLTIVLTLLAFVIGVVLTGLLGDQGRGLDALPFIVGGAFAALVAAARLRGQRHGTGQE